MTHKILKITELEVYRQRILIVKPDPLGPKK